MSKISSPCFSRSPFSSVYNYIKTYINCAWHRYYYCYMLNYMTNRYNFFYFEAEFKKYLIAGKAESSTIKNYLSDLHYFFSWVQSTKQLIDLDYSDLPEVFSHSLVRSYHTYLSSATNSQLGVYSCVRGIVNKGVARGEWGRQSATSAVFCLRGIRCAASGAFTLLGFP